MNHLGENMALPTHKKINNHTLPLPLSERVEEK
jgi:hypothetical protein